MNGRGTRLAEQEQFVGGTEAALLYYTWPEEVSPGGVQDIYFATEEPAPATRVPIGFSSQADVTAALDDNGTGTTR